MSGRTLAWNSVKAVYDTVWNDDPSPMTQTEWAHTSIAILGAFGIFVFFSLCYAWWKMREVRECDNLSGLKPQVSIRRKK